MGTFILRRVGMMILTALCLTFIVFMLTNLHPNLEKLAKTQGNFRMSDEEVASWLDGNGYSDPMLVKYGQWLGVWPGWTLETEDGWTGVASAPPKIPKTPQGFAGSLKGIGGIRPFSETRSAAS